MRYVNRKVVVEFTATITIKRKYTNKSWVALHWKSVAKNRHNGELAAEQPKHTQHKHISYPSLSLSFPPLPVQLNDIKQICK